MRYSINCAFLPCLFNIEFWCPDTVLWCPSDTGLERTITLEDMDLSICKEIFRLYINNTLYFSVNVLYHDKFVMIFFPNKIEMGSKDMEWEPSSGEFYYNDTRLNSFGSLHLQSQNWNETICFSKSIPPADMTNSIKVCLCMRMYYPAP